MTMSRCHERAPSFIFRPSPLAFSDPHLCLFEPPSFACLPPPLACLPPLSVYPLPYCLPPLTVSQGAITEEGFFEFIRKTLVADLPPSKLPSDGF